MIAAKESDELFDWVDGHAYFCRQRVEFREIVLGDHTFNVAALVDAAGLLDDDEFAKPFLEEDRAPYGLELWPAALMLSDYILQGEPGAGRSALDLGCGVGLVAMAAARRGWQVTGVDHDPSALRFAQRNARKNGETQLLFDRFDWKTPFFGQRFDRVFAADVLYQRIDHLPILKCIESLLADGGLAFLADPNRKVADSFPARSRERGFEVTEIKTSATLPSGAAIAGRLYTLSRAAG